MINKFLKPLIAYASWVLQLAHDIVRARLKVAEDFFQRSLPAVGFAVLFPGQPAEQVSGSVVEFVVEEVVADAYIRRTVPTPIQRSRTIESERHEKMAGLAAKLAHYRIMTARIPTGRWMCCGKPSLIAWTEIVFEFLPVLTDKIPVGVRPEDFAARVLRGHLFASSSHEPGAGKRCSGNRPFL